MSASSDSFERLQEIFPSEIDSITRLRDLLVRPVTPQTSYTFKRIFDAAMPRSHIVLLEILAELEDLSIVRRAYVVKSRDGVAVGKFPNFLSVPSSVFDDDSEQEIVVTRDNLEVRYEVSGS